MVRRGNASESNDGSDRAAAGPNEIPTGIIHQKKIHSIKKREDGVQVKHIYRGGAHQNCPGKRKETKGQ